MHSQNKNESDPALPLARNFSEQGSVAGNRATGCPAAMPRDDSCEGLEEGLEDARAARRGGSGGGSNGVVRRQAGG